MVLCRAHPSLCFLPAPKATGPTSRFQALWGLGRWPRNGQDWVGLEWLGEAREDGAGE